MAEEELYVRLRHKGHFIWCNFKANLISAIDKVKAQLNIAENVDLVFMDKDGAIISKDFLIDYIKFHEKGVILQIQTDTVDEIDIDASRSNNSTLTVYEENTINNQNTEDIQILQIESCHNANSDILAFDLETLLNTTPLGNSVLNYYKTNGILDNTRRNRLVDTISKHIFTYIINHRLKHPEYNILTSKIISLFPNESASTYYVPAIRKADSTNRKHILARGKLVDKTKNLIFLSGERRRKSTPEEEALSDTEDDNAEGASVWLKTRNEPWCEVVEQWKIAYTKRKRDTCNNLQDFFNNWPILRDARADTLINIDFDFLYPNSGLLLISGWNHFLNKIKECGSKSDDCNVLLNCLEQSTDESSRLTCHTYRPLQSTFKRKTEISEKFLAKVLAQLFTITQ
ncbi:hypothetical protein QE152_g38780 [Popillia japonica]|uniref:Uncharacterized protein n=1 Tax=Popillia japonica TaxID=7064 RepID=A0AAW1HVF9_POPJA